MAALLALDLVGPLLGHLRTLARTGARPDGLPGVCRAWRAAGCPVGHTLTPTSAILLALLADHLQSPLPSERRVEAVERALVAWAAAGCPDTPGEAA